MPKVTPRHKNENFESMFRRWKKAVEKAGTMQDYRKHEFFEKNCEIRKRERAAAKKRAQRASAEARAPGAVSA